MMVSLVAFISRSVHLAEAYFLNAFTAALDDMEADADDGRIGERSSGDSSHAVW